MTSDDKITLLKIKSLLNSLSYIIKLEHHPTVEAFHKLCRKFASNGGENENNEKVKT